MAVIKGVNVRTNKIVGCLILIELLICAVLSAEDVSERIGVEWLIFQLPNNSAGRPIDRELLKTIASRGEQALPALEKELHLGKSSKEMQLLRSAGLSRRGAVVQVLERIPGERSTALLVSSLADPPDTHGMRYGTLLALSKRDLTVDQILRMLKNHHPEVVLAGIAHASRSKDSSQLTEGLEQVFDKGQAMTQFHNEYGASMASEDRLWEVRLAAGQALKKDMVPEMRVRAREILAVLKAEAVQPTSPDKAEWMGCTSKTEYTICSSIRKLSSLGEPVKSLVENEASQAQGDHAKVLAMALVGLGDPSKVAQVADDLVNSKNHTIRYCAAVTLRISGDRSALPALRKAMRDPYQREDASCTREASMVYPVRMIVADALISLGEDPVTVRKEQGQK